MPTHLKNLTIGELTICENPANQHSFATIFKSEEPLVESIVKSCIDIDAGSVGFGELLADREASRKRWAAREELWPIMDALRDSVNSTITDSALTADDRLGRIQQSAFEFVGAVREKFPDVEAELNKLFDETVNKESSMTDAEKAQLAELEKKFNDSQAALAEATAMAKMSDKDKEHLAGLKDEDEKKKFLAKSADERAQIVKAASSADEVLKTADGIEIKKSVVGSTMFEIVKSQEARISAQNAEIKKAQDAAELATLEKSAKADYGSLPGTDIAKAQLLKSVNALPEAERNTLTAMLKAGEAAMKASFSMSGHRSDVEKNADSALEQAIAKHRAANPNDSVEQATDKVLAANPSLYDATQAQVAN